MFHKSALGQDTTFSGAGMGLESEGFYPLRDSHKEKERPFMKQVWHFRYIDKVAGLEIG